MTDEKKDKTFFVTIHESWSWQATKGSSIYFNTCHVVFQNIKEASFYTHLIVILNASVPLTKERDPGEGNICCFNSFHAIFEKTHSSMIC